MLAQRLVAHRGYQARYPENTLVSLRAAIAAGARFIETDVLFSADGEPVLYHDVLMQRISGLNNAIHLLNLAELVACPAHEPARLGSRHAEEKIASLTDLTGLLMANPQVTAFVELKRAGLHLVGAAHAFARVTGCLAPVIDRIVLISFDDAFIEYAHQQGFTRLGMVLKEWQERNSAAVTGIKPEFLFCDWEKIPPDCSLELPDSKLVVYEVDDPEQGVMLFHRGADMLESFDIAGMLEGLARHAL